MTYVERMQLAERAARASGKMLLDHPRTEVRHKAENDYVTNMDSASEELIRSILLEACPEDGFYGEEEGGSENTEHRWIVDPIDGTSNFFKGHPLYTISVAYEEKGELVAGCVLCPRTGECWTAAKGYGAYLNGEPIHVSDCENTRESFLHISFNHRNRIANRYIMGVLPEITQSFSDLRRTGSAAYDFCSVASGRSEGFFEFCLHIYDIAAGVVILREAGGMMTSFKDEWDPLEGCHVVISNGHIHEKLRALLLKGDLTLLDKISQE